VNAHLEAFLADLRSASPAQLAEIRSLIGSLPDETAPLESTGSAADRLGVRPKTIAEWCRAGRLAGAVLVGRSWRIPVDAVPDAPVRDEVTARRDRRRRGPASQSVSDRIAGSPSGSMRSTTSTTGGPGDVGASRGPAHRNRGPMSSKNGTRHGDPATVVSIDGRTR
jgi:excisionase family DNA binding protein